jgi:hypothetical protein
MLYVALTNRAQHKLRVRQVMTDCVSVGHWRVLQSRIVDTKFRENQSIQTQE